MGILCTIVEPTADLVPLGSNTDLVHRRRISTKPVGDDAAGSAVLLHDPLEKLQRRGFVSLRSSHRFQDLAFMIDGAPKITELAVDLHKHLIQMSCMDAPARARWFRMVWSRDRVRSCIRPSGAACHDRWPVWRCADQAQISAASAIEFPGPDLTDHLPLPFLDLLTR